MRSVEVGFLGGGETEQAALHCVKVRVVREVRWVVLVFGLLVMMVVIFSISERSFVRFVFKLYIVFGL